MDERRRQGAQRQGQGRRGRGGARHASSGWMSWTRWVTRKQEVLYNLFEWSLSAPRRVPRLAVIGIANTMDLPERLTEGLHRELV